MAESKTAKLRWEEKKTLVLRRSYGVVYNSDDKIVATIKHPAYKMLCNVICLGVNAVPLYEKIAEKSCDCLRHVKAFFTERDSGEVTPQQHMVKFQRLSKEIESALAEEKKIKGMLEAACADSLDG